MEYTRNVGIFVKNYNMRYLFFLLSIVLVSCEKEITIIPIDPPSPPVTKTYEGYKVNSNAKQLGKEYWLRGTGIPQDLIIQTFQNPLPLSNSFAYKHNFINAGWSQSVAGDFNLDGWVDVFTPGAGDFISPSFLIFNTKTNTYDETSLFNQDVKSLPFAFKIIPYYLNEDDYVDMVVFTDDSPETPIKLIVSDGTGKYNLIPIFENEDRTYPTSCCGNATITKAGGDIGDLDGDGLPEMVVGANNFMFIYKGIKGSPYFTSSGKKVFVEDEINFPNVNNNGFGESCSECAGNVGVIADVNKDGINDIVLSVYESGLKSQKILLNKGQGRFNNSSILRLSQYGKETSTNDYVLTDNGDIIATNGFGVDGKSSYWNIFVYKKTNNGYVLDKSVVEFNPNMKTKSRDGGKPKLLYYDYNKDGIKDIGYVDASWGDEMGDKNIMKYKTVFIKTGDKYVEHDFYQYDLVSKNYLLILEKRFK